MSIFDEAKQVMENIPADIFSDVVDTLDVFWPIVVIIIGGLLAFIILDSVIDLITHKSNYNDFYDHEDEEEDY